jgi:hypothetical protein
MSFFRDIRSFSFTCIWLTTALFLFVAISAPAQEDSLPGTNSKRMETRKKKNREREDKNETGKVVYSATSKSMKVNLGSGKHNYILIDWVKPAGENIVLQDGHLEIKLKIFSPDLVRDQNVVVYHNQERLGSKMDVSGLLGGQKEFNYTNRVLLVEGVNEIIIKVTTEKLTKSSDPLIVHKSGNTVSVRAMGVASPYDNPSTSVYWWTLFDPVNLNGKPYSSKEKVLPVRFKILTSETLSLDSVRVRHNGQAMRAGPKASFQKDYQGNYSFSDEIELLEFGELNEIYLEVSASGSTIRSEKLIVDYSPLRPNLHILSVGTETNLQYTLKDARDFARLFTSQGGVTGNSIFSKVLIDTLIGSYATAQEIKGTIEELKVRYFTGSISADDVILAFISSHGFLLDGDFRVQGDDYSPARQRSTSVSFRNEVVGILDAIPCKKIIMIDACHSGGARANPSDINFEINKLNSIEKGMSVFASSRGEEQSYEDALWQNGAFTACIIQALKGGKADADGNRIISLHELSGYVSKEVAAIVKKVKKRQQNPVLVNDELGDVAIYVMKR